MSDRPIRVLLIEDNPGDARLIEGMLSEAGGRLFHLVRVDRLSAGLERLAAGDIAAVLLDLGLPDSQGFETFDRVQRQAPQVPIILLTGGDDEELAIRAVGQGGQDYLVKGQVDGRLLARTLRYGIERKQAEEEIRKLSLAVEQSPNLVIISNVAGRIEYVNPKFVQVTGYSPEDVIGKTPRMLRSDKTPPEVFTGVLEAITSGHEWRGEYINKTKDGADFWVQAAISPIKSSDGTITHFVGIEEDITERKQAEVALRESEKKYRRLVETLQEGIWLIDKDACTTFVNRHMAAMLGHTVEEMQGKPLFSFMDERGVQIAKRLLERRVQGIKEQHDFEFLRKDGSRIYATLETGPLTDEAGNYVGAIAGVIDITERKRVEEELLKLRTAVDTSGEVIFMTDCHGIIIFANPEFTHLYGYTASEVVGKSTPRILKSGVMKPEDYANFWQTLLNKQLVKGELINKTKDGRLLTIESSINPILDERQEIVGFLAIQRDVTERKRVEATLLQSEEKYHTLIDSMQDGVFVIQDAKMQFVNEAFARMVGYTVEEVIGMDFRQLVAPEDLEIVADRYLKRQAGEDVPREYEFRALHKDGKTRVLVNMNVGLVDYQGRVASMGTVKDITERKRAEDELRQSREQLRALAIYLESARENERARIAREIHDDFGQSMTALKMDLDWLAKRLPEGDERLRRIGGMNTLVDDSINLGRRIASSLRPGLLDDLGLAAALEWQAAGFSERTGIVCELSLPPDDLDLDPALNTTLFRIFQEAVTNVARHAHATRVEASLQQESNTLILIIHDNGRGLTESEINDPRSLGLLGLRERAAQWGGSLTLVGAPGEGTTVTVQIPLPASPASGGGR